MATANSTRSSFEFDRKFMASAAIVPYLVLLLTGCSVVHSYTAANHRRDDGPDPVGATRATMRLADADMEDGVFVGIAMSGGGARAANFSAATLLQLESLGFLPHASAISAVSGSALTAAYYGLYARSGQSPEERRRYWNSETVRERFLVDFQTHWLVRWFNPWNIVRYWFTDFDRSDIMKGVFDEYLFQDRRPPRFADLGAGRPKILINATSLPQTAGFVFTDESLESLGSRLDTYPLSHAVMASGAFPGAFHNVTLEDFRRPGYYQHLFDGGPADNLGVHTLLALIDAAQPRGGCFIFIVDAYPYQTGKGEDQSDTRGVFDFFVDQNVSDSSNVFLTLRRYDTLRRYLQYPAASKVGEVPQWDFTTDGGVACRVWHLTFQSLIVREGTRTQESREARRNLKRQLEEERKVNLIPTRYRLQGPKGMNAQEVQGLIFGVAQHLVRDDDDTLHHACEWFKDRHLDACLAPGPGGP
jgi:predicted acylesterase/phospholipase RssA